MHLGDYSLQRIMPSPTMWTVSKKGARCEGRKAFTLISQLCALTFLCWLTHSWPPYQPCPSAPERCPSAAAPSRQ